ncbi:MAG: hypothetical protein WC499_00840 [Patescibacteria group bacterium]
MSEKTKSLKGRQGKIEWLKNIFSWNKKPIKWLLRGCQYGLYKGRPKCRRFKNYCDCK